MIKKHSNKNEYVFSGVWVRNFTKKAVIPIDINELVNKEDMPLMLENETANHSKMLQRIDTENFHHPKICIVSDGYQFETKQKILESLPDDVIVIGVNDTLNYWNNRRKMHYYVVNNPYPECLNFLRNKRIVFPRCVASSRTNPEFIDKFNGLTYEYSPTVDQHYSGLTSEAIWTIDDYRNPICAAIGLAYKFGVEKMLLFCCTEVYEEEKPGAVKKNGIWTYPNQILANQIVDGNLFWLKNTKIGHHTKWTYKNSNYIEEGEIQKFYA